MMTRRWLGWLAAALVVALACTLLGRWQFGRYEDRIATERHLEANYNGEPVDIRQAHPDPAVILEEIGQPDPFVPQRDKGQDVARRDLLRAVPDRVKLAPATDRPGKKILATCPQSEHRHQTLF